MRPSTSGDSLMVEIVENIDIAPWSHSASALHVRPMIGCVRRKTLRVRSGLICFHESPRSSLRHTYCDA